MEPGRVAITIRSFEHSGPALDKLQEHCTIAYTNTTGGRLTEDALCEVLRDVHGVIAGTEPYTRRVLESARRLRVISRVGVGTDSIDLATADARGIRVFITPEATVQPVAEHSLALLFAVLKRIVLSAESMRRGEFSPEPGRLLSGKSVGVVGLGRIGFRVARMLELLGCRISYYDPAPREEAPPRWHAAGSITDLVTDVDILTLHAPAQPSGEPLIDAAVLSEAQTGLIIINTARGSLIDEEALSAGLKSGRIAGAGLDVFTSEPYQGPLLALPQVVATPHVASFTVESRAEMELEAVENLVNGLGMTAQ
jgi:D-3-phosphoglycerate dehydrogenase